MVLAFDMVSSLWTRLDWRSEASTEDIAPVNSQAYSIRSVPIANLPDEQMRYYRTII
jgi:hypothetical protein